MKAWIAENAVTRVTVSATTLANECLEFFLQKYIHQAVNALTISQLSGLVYRSRSKEFYDWESIIQSHPLVHCSDTDERLFLQFNANICVGGDMMQKIIGWAHPDILFHCQNYPMNLFIDCTFHVPKGFEQCLIIIVYLPQFDEYVPLTWILLQSKSRNTYQAALMHCIAMCDWRLRAHSICTDFETGLYQASISNFPEAKSILCYFHWKQAIRRKLISLKLPDLIVSRLIGEGGLLELLTYIDEADIRIGKYSVILNVNISLIKFLRCILFRHSFHPRILEERVRTGYCYE